MTTDACCCLLFWMSTRTTWPRYSACSLVAAAFIAARFMMSASIFQILNRGRNVFMLAAVNIQKQGSVSGVLSLPTRIIIMLAVAGACRVPCVGQITAQAQRCRLPCEGKTAQTHTATPWTRNAHNADGTRTTTPVRTSTYAARVTKTWWRAHAGTPTPWACSS